LPLADEHVAEEKAPRTGYAHDNQEGGSQEPRLFRNEFPSGSASSSCG